MISQCFNEEDITAEIVIEWNEGGSCVDMFIEARDAHPTAPQTPISLEELLREQLGEEYCESIRKRIDDCENMSFRDEVRYSHRSPSRIIKGYNSVVFVFALIIVD